MILAVERSCVSLCREDANMSLDRLHGVAENSLKDGLKSLGFDLSKHVSRGEVDAPFKLHTKCYFRD